MDSPALAPMPAREVAYYGRREPIAWGLLRRLNVLTIVAGSLGLFALCLMLPELVPWALTDGPSNPGFWQLGAWLQWGLPAYAVLAAVGCIARWHAGRRAIVAWAALAMIERSVTLAFATVLLWRSIGSGMNASAWAGWMAWVLYWLAESAQGFALPWAVWVWWRTAAARRWCEAGLPELPVTTEIDAETVRAFGRMVTGFAALGCVAGVFGVLSLLRIWLVVAWDPKQIDPTLVYVPHRAVLDTLGCVPSLLGMAGGVLVFRGRICGARLLLWWAWGTIAAAVAHVSFHAGIFGTFPFGGLNLMSGAFLLTFLSAAAMTTPVVMLPLLLSRVARSARQDVEMPPRGGSMPA